MCAELVTATPNCFQPDNRASTEEQLKQNLEAVGWNLTPEQVKRLDNASQVTPIYPYWHQAQFPFLNAQIQF